MRKNRKPLFKNVQGKECHPIAAARGLAALRVARKAPGSMASIDPYSAGAEQGIKKHLLCHIENVGATIGRPPT